MAGPSVGEIFINVGIKGAEKTVAAVSNITKGMGELYSGSLEAKAGILGAVYEFERLMEMSGRAGTTLTNFEAYTGKTAAELQKWQYAARQAGVSNEEFAASFKNVQSAMAELALHQRSPEGLGLVGRAVGLDRNRAINDPAYLLTKLQEYSHKVPASIGNQILKSFGLSEGVIAAMRRNAFRPEVFAKAPTYSESEISALDRADIAWSNLSTHIQMAFGHFNAREGGRIVTQISHITDQIIRMVEALIRLGEKLHVFDLIEAGAKTINNVLEKDNQLVDLVRGKGKSKNETDRAEQIAKILFSLMNPIGSLISEKITTALASSARSGINSNTHNQTTNVNVTHVGDSKDTAQVKQLYQTIGKIHKQHINNSRTQLTTVNQAN